MDKLPYSRVESHEYLFSKTQFGSIERADELLMPFEERISKSPYAREFGLVHLPDERMLCDSVQVDEVLVRIAIFFRVIETGTVELVRLCISNDGQIHQTQNLSPCPSPASIKAA